MQADVHLQVDVPGAPRFDHGLHLGRCRHCIVGAPECAHGLVTDGLDDTAIKARHHLANQRQAGIDDGACRVVAERAIEFVTVGDIREKNREIFVNACHWSTSQPPGRLSHKQAAQQPRPRA